MDRLELFLLQGKAMLGFDLKIADSLGDGLGVDVEL